MSGIIETKNQLKRIYNNYESYINPVLKFLLAFVILLVMNAKIGYMGKIDNIVIVLILALVCSFLPLKATALISGLFMLLHLYALGIECALVTAVMFMLMFLIYARFVPNETIVILITPILFILKIPYLIPVVMGLVGNPLSILSVSFGVIVASLIDYISKNAEALTTMEDSNMMTRVRFIVDGVIANKSMIILVIVFAITLMIVYTIRRRAIDHSWKIAIFAGVITNVVVLMIGTLILNLDISMIGIIFGNAISVAVGLVLEMFRFNLDYENAQNLQFEDDDFYYYVKAVPKVAAHESPKKTRKPAPTKSAQSRSSHPSQGGAQRPHNGGTKTVHTANGTTRTIKK